MSRYRTRKGPERSRGEVRGSDGTEEMWDRCDIVTAEEWVREGRGTKGDWGLGNNVDCLRRVGSGEDSV